MLLLCSEVSLLTVKITVNRIDGEFSHISFLLEKSITKVVSAKPTIYTFYLVSIHPKHIILEISFRNQVGEIRNFTL